MGDPSASTTASDRFDLSDSLSKTSWIMIAVAVFSTEILVLKPHWWEYVPYVLLDAILVGPMNRVKNYFLTRTNPEAKAFFPVCELSRIQGYSAEESMRFLRWLFALPYRQAIYGFLLSIPKAIPGTLLIVFWWKYDHSRWLQAALTIGITLMTLTYFSVLSYIEGHRQCSALLERIQPDRAWRRAFNAIAVERAAPPAAEVWYTFFAPAFVTFFQGVLVYSSLGIERPTHVLMFQVIFVGLATLALLARSIYLWRDYLMSSFERIFGQICDRDVASSRVVKTGVSPLTYLPLTKFVSIFNNLFEVIDAREREFEAFILESAEKERFRTLGEMSALIAHDLAGPVHSLDFSIRQALDDPERLRDARYQNVIDSSLGQITTLIQTLRTRLRYPTSTETEKSVSECAHVAHNFLSKQLRPSAETFGLQMEVDPTLQFAHVCLPAPELIQIFENLLKNTMEAARQAGVVNPSVNVERELTDTGKVRFTYADNAGASFTEEEFENMTGFGALAAPRGLGLRLVRRILERYRGQITSFENARGPGFYLRVTLPAAVSSSANLTSLQSENL